ncbi:hypothetical protein LEP1GSC196_0174 [Leptospira meyeri serovar Semaranga str. Veldrot Semarang 173]|nr:hypothetical protein LEP1GSC196_0174 [Leptospira meyeri serovar Semaranga str. Veldrot Semarang 173]
MVLFFFFSCRKETSMVDEKYQNIDPTRFRKEIGGQAGNLFVYDFYEVIHKQSSRTYLSIHFDKEAGRFVSFLQVGFYAAIDTLKEVYCIKFTKEFRDCRLSFILSPYTDMTPVVIYLRSRNDKLFYLMHPDAEYPMFLGHGHIDSEEFLKSAKEC